MEYAHSKPVYILRIEEHHHSGYDYALRSMENAHRNGDHNYYNCDGIIGRLKQLPELKNDIAYLRLSLRSLLMALEYHEVTLFTEVCISFAIS
ncbi:MAG: hypothetical protein ABI855_06620, partial [Bacteroidota bacterium]